MTGKFRLVVKAYHDENIDIFVGDYVWTQEQAEDLLSMFNALHGDTYCNWIEMESENERT